ncbi:MAG TPA: trypsin-like peptidase domain-containing protein [Xanthomonadaceae bacterium]|nr:trypsin-like peptidase domain-containing protein [Xanthomonadaceae bacterium]
MKSRALKTALFLVQSVVAGLALAFLALIAAPDAVDRLRGTWHGAPPLPAVTPSPDAVAATVGPASYSDAVARAAPSVVNIYANKIVTERSVRLVPNPYLQRFSGISVGPPRQRLEQSLGSGVIVSPDGYVLTNHHVIAGADDIQAVLWDGRVTRASVVGSDRETDLAVLRIEGSDLPAMPLSEEVGLRVGDVALAIGNPFGMGQTVTLGIISATGRNQLNLTTYEDFIQTDAAINTGNSGGALINAHGELVGINTAVFGRGTGAEGIGFAIPVRTASMVLDQIVRHGFVVRGWLGLEYVDAPTLSGEATRRGVAVAAVYPASPADHAGLRPGDILLTLDGTDIADQNDLRTREAALPPGSKSQVSGLRAGVPFSTDMVLAQRPLPRGAS